MITFSLNPSVKSLMVFESTFDPELRMSYKEKLGLLKLMSLVGAMYINGKIAGEFYGFEMGRAEKVDEFLDIKQYPHDPPKNYPQFGKIKIDTCCDFYCHSNGLLLEFQGKGYGTIMKSYMLGVLKGTGYNRVIGHAHHNGSLQLNLKFGAKIHYDFLNWYETGHKYSLYTLEL